MCYSEMLRKRIQVSFLYPNSGIARQSSANSHNLMGSRTLEIKFIVICHRHNM